MSGSRRQARWFLSLVCAMFTVMLLLFGFLPDLLQRPLMGHSLTLGIPLAFIFIVTVFGLMIYYVVSRGPE